MQYILNMKLKHSVFGEGVLKSYSGNSLTVRFAQEEKEFSFPQAFEEGALQTLNDADKNRIAVLREDWEKHRNGTAACGKAEEPVGNLVVVLTEVTNAYLGLIGLFMLAFFCPIVLLCMKLSTRFYTASGKSRFIGEPAMYYVYNMLVAYGTLFSLGIAYPFLLAWKLKWETGQIFIDDRRLVFDGRGKEIFGESMLWLFLSVITLGVCSAFWQVKIERWRMEHTHFEGNEKGHSEFNGTIGKTGGVNLACFFSAPWTYCYKQRWYTKHRIIDGNRLVFDGTSKEYVRKFFKWVLLSFVTFGIYDIWANVEEKNWTVSHIHILE